MRLDIGDKAKEPKYGKKVTLTLYEGEVIVLLSLLGKATTSAIHEAVDNQRSAYRNPVTEKDAKLGHNVEKDGFTFDTYNYLAYTLGYLVWDLKDDRSDWNV